MATLDRRQFLGAAAAAALTARGLWAAEQAAKPVLCLNTSTIQGSKIPLLEQIEIAAAAGYGGIEFWMRDIEAFTRGGGKLADAKKRMADLNLAPQNGIGFARWVVDNDADRAKGVEQIKREMEMLAQLGARFIAAPPSGVYEVPGMATERIAERYRALLEAGQQIGIRPLIEFWGGAKTLGRLDESLAAAKAANHPKAGVLGDVYHMYKGGSDLSLLAGMPDGMMPVLHMNDYPADPPREKIGDGDRIYPGDGIAPIKQILKDVLPKNPGCVLSIELFNRTYYQRPAAEVAKTGVEKMKAFL